MGLTITGRSPFPLGSAWSFLFLLPVTATAQQWEVFDMVTAGFPSTTVQCLAQDAQGRIWAGTDWGLCVYDGVNWEVWQSGNTGLPENDITALAFDAQDRLWVGTIQSGVAVFDGQGWTVHHPGNSPLPDGQVNGLAIDALGRAWIGTPGGLAMTDGTHWRVYDDSPQSHGGFRLFGRHVRGVATRVDGLVAVTTMNGGFACLTETEFICYTSQLHNFPDNSGNSVAFDSAGDRWVGTPSGGLVRHAGPFLDGIWFQYTAQNSGLPENTVRSVVVEANGRKVVGTEVSGVAFLTLGGVWSVLNAANSGLPDNHVRSLLVDRDGVLWVGTLLGGLARYRSEAGITGSGQGLGLVRAWPNPAWEEVFFDTGATSGDLEWTLLDGMGRTFATGRASAGGPVRIGVAGLAPGTYVLRIAGHGSMGFMRLMKR